MPIQWETNVEGKLWAALVAEKRLIAVDLAGTMRCFGTPRPHPGLNPKMHREPDATIRQAQPQTANLIVTCSCHYRTTARDGYAVMDQPRASRNCGHGFEQTRFHILALVADRAACRVAAHGVAGQRDPGLARGRRARRSADSTTAALPGGTHSDRYVSIPAESDHVGLPGGGCSPPCGPIPVLRSSRAQLLIQPAYTRCSDDSPEISHGTVSGLLRSAKRTVAGCRYLDQPKR